MRKRTSRIFPDGITECNEVYAPFSDGWQYCDAIYKCDENSVMTCLWEKLAGKNLVKKPYARVVAVRYIDGITYAVLFIYLSSYYTAGFYWVARYDSDNNRWIALYKYTKIKQNTSEYNYLSIVSSKKGMMIGGFEYTRTGEKYYFTGYDFAKVDKDNLDELSFETPVQGGFIGENDTMILSPYFGYSGSIEDIRYAGYSMIDRYGYYQNYDYFGYDGEKEKTVSIMPFFKALGKTFRFDVESKSFNTGYGGWHGYKNIYFTDLDGNKIYIDGSLFSDEYVEYCEISAFYKYGKQIAPCFIQDAERIIIPIMTEQYKIENFGTRGETEVETGVFLNFIIFTGQETFKACERIKLQTTQKGDILGAYKVGDYYVFYIRYYDGEWHTYAYAGPLSAIQKIDYDMESYNPCGAMLIDGKLCFLLGDKSNIYNNRIVKISNGTATTITIPTYAWEEQ